MDFDRILVIRDGLGAEFGTPKELMGIQNGVFRGILMESREREVLERVVATCSLTGKQDRRLKVILQSIYS